MTKLADYKFWFVRRDDDGYITEAAIRFFEGEMRDIEERRLDVADQKMKKVIVNRYVREKELIKEDLATCVSRETQKDSRGVDTFIYTPEDFGRIRDDEELRAFLNKELAKDETREPIKAQKVK